MNTERTITVSGIQVQVVRKPIKNLHLGVYPPNGRVRVAAPLSVSDQAVRLAVVGKLGWIKRRRARFEDQPRQSKREMVSGESHYVWGRRYRLRVVQSDENAFILHRANHRLELRVLPGTDAESREIILYRWYRQLLREQIPALIAKWEPVVGVKVTDWRIKRMKTRWGTCNFDAGRIWINLELAKKPPVCLEYIVVHEMVHLLERKHTNKFREYMDKFMPQWQRYRDELNQMPLSHESWGY
jgi:predicted metal-dependent hydrolase